MIAGQVLGVVAYVLGWMKGGHAERFGAAVLLVNYMTSSLTYSWRIGDFYWASAIHDVVLFAIFGWLGLRSTRWWPLAITAIFTLVLIVRAVATLDPNLSQRELASAHIGLWYLVDGALLAGVAERWLAGEAAARPSRPWRPLGRSRIWPRRCG